MALEQNSGVIGLGEAADFRSGRFFRLQFVAKSGGQDFPDRREQALALGCKLLKFFPAEAAGGTAMLKSLAGPYAHTGVRFIPTGGIGPKNLQDYLKLPIVAAIGGSWMVEKSLVAEGRWSEITALTKAALAAAGAAR